MSAESQRSDTPSVTAVSSFNFLKSILKCKIPYVKYLVLLPRFLVLLFPQNNKKKKFAFVESFMFSS